ncbi:MAG: propanediol utilization protein [Candidatus Staskawiczbacteria bacterium RIFOXYC1_FULL_37_43]|nr:MAG: propanediol utilization protein [Candidatus Staskawiczbacteria bacterium RIFOXYA1_FULL_37_15]OGZ77856.1 MAG: propanediol utilization protein [Candidatus Staskawiczbacteria bacterium RIFOXYA12_FULL_37_10]OGZ80035.1 MAG: propanediol utilization protein [Candidatus Staskawiczbacteria bacterium RIFOXYB1_FULL_38_37]OGZ81674.1 MAG: propanediol utilization protein [Candidatus Staskawiczbacteria bacterium RIFOXYC1_FULL_37_43]OGZ82029.1 MAG: propanediol utilization protein [Candidatus Staskawicz
MDKIPIEVSARHVHLSQKDLEILFGKGYELKKLKQLSQPSDFACHETADIQVGSKKIEKVRIVGPLREQTQVEISKTDAVFLDVNPPVCLSGDLSDSCGIKLIGPNGEVDLEKGLIIALRHIHCAKSEAKVIGLKDKDAVAVKIDSNRPVTFYDVLVRVRDDYKLCMHIDTDEGNAAGINKIGAGQIL